MKNWEISPKDSAIEVQSRWRHIIIVTWLILHCCVKRYPKSAGNLINIEVTLLNDLVFENQKFNTMDTEADWIKFKSTKATSCSCWV